MKLDDFNKFIYVFGVLFCIPWSIFLLSYVDVNDYLLLALLIVIPTGCWFYAMSHGKETKGVWAKYFFYGIWGITLSITLNNYLNVGEPFVVTTKIIEADAWTLRGKRGEADHYMTYHFADGKFNTSPLLRIYNGRMGVYGSSAKMRMTFRYGVFGSPVLQKTEWLDENDSLVLKRDDE